MELLLFFYFYFFLIFPICFKSHEMEQTGILGESWLFWASLLLLVDDLGGKYYPVPSFCQL